MFEITSINTLIEAVIIIGLLTLMATAMWD
jgi:hypothetical protein